MKKLIVGVAFAALLFPTLAVAGQPKVDVCHAAGLAGTTKYVTLNVPATETGYPKGHFTENGTQEAGHEQDYLGPCQPEATPTPEPTSTTTPTPEPSDSPSPSATPTTSPSVSPTPVAPTARPTLPPTDT